MQQASGDTVLVQRPGALLEGQVRLARMPEADLLAICERVQARVVATAVASPRPEEERHRRAQGMERRLSHGTAS
ncbi:MAG: hypothetical protein H0W81_09665 [Chloroflexi bacterium]|nr:hypothetical protein [Chloroflexota bacterium]